MKKQPIYLKNVCVHNLKGVDLKLDPGSFIVFTGVSGSGKSSLAFNTIYVEGQRRYIESLSTCARRYIGNLPKPEADLIEGISPTIAIEQKTMGKNPRSTVGTITSIYDYLRVLFARISTPHCPISGERVEPQSSTSIFFTIKTFPQGSQLVFLAPYVKGKRGGFKELFKELVRKGFLRIRLDGEIVNLEEKILVDRHVAHDIDLVVDRIILKESEKKRIIEAVERSLELGKGVMSVVNQTEKKETLFSQHAYSKSSNVSYPPLEPQDFSFNHPAGMCPACEGLGVKREFDLAKIIDPKLSIAAGCCTIAGLYNTEKWRNIYKLLAKHYKFSLHTPWYKLSTAIQNMFLYGNVQNEIEIKVPYSRQKTSIQWHGVLYYAKQRIAAAKSSAYHNKMKSLMYETVCFQCKGARIKPYPAAATLAKKAIHHLTSLTIEELFSFFESLKLSPYKENIAHDLVLEIKKRLFFLLNVGLHYLSLDRAAPTLSGGEGQRVRLASQIGCGLVGTTYILDEPSIGLHPRDNTKLLHTLQLIKDQGNTVIVVEHDEETMEAADYIVDIGPKAGSLGGKIVAQGTIADLIKAPNSLTGAYLGKRKSIPISQQKRKPSNKKVIIEGASHYNLKNLTAEIPLGLFVAVTGVSGSGKSSLIGDILYPALKNALHRGGVKVGEHKRITGIDYLDKVIGIDQSPIGRTPRSNPATYVKFFDDIRNLFSMLPESQAAGFGPGRFSFNVREGSCSQCHGMGMVRLDMDFMDDVWTTCSLCEGKRFDSKTLSILYKQKNIHEILEMTIEEASVFFHNFPLIARKLSLLKQVGIGYLTLGQSSTTLSGGEAQRIKLAREMIRPSRGNTLYILDEPTTGLHFHDINKLVHILHCLVDKGNSVLVIEHNIDLVRTADWIIDLGPEGGKNGGEIVASGPPEYIQTLNTPTGIALQQKKRELHKSALHTCGPLTAIQAVGCNQNNLRNLSLTIPRGKISICTGPSGSGKSSFAFETIYAEGQRRYIESLSPYARQFVKQMPKPKLEEITGLSPSIAIEQKHHAGNPRSTIGTITEIYDLLRLLFAHAGTAYCPETGEKIEAISKEYVVDQLMNFPEKTPLSILAPIKISSRETIEEVRNHLIKQGFLRIRLNGKYYTLDEEIPYQKNRKNMLYLVVDRIVIGPGVEKRVFEAIEQAVRFSPEPFLVATKEKDLLYNLTFAVPSTGRTYPLITPHTFSFNTNEGMCPHCLGLGIEFGANIEHHEGILSLSAYTIMVYLWKHYVTEMAAMFFMRFLEDSGIDPNIPLGELSEKHLQILLYGSPDYFTYNGVEVRWGGINPALEKLGKTGKELIKKSLFPLFEPKTCRSCQGERLNSLARNVRVGKVTIGELCNLPLNKALSFCTKLQVAKHLQEVVDQIKSRLSFLCQIGLDYLSLSRSAPTLSGGEIQRIHLARQLGSGLTSCLYVLDEPTIGLHPHNNEKLNKALIALKDLGNTLLLVEHDPLTLKIADHVFDFGPDGGSHGGKLVAQGSIAQIKRNPHSLTGAYLSYKKRVPYPEKRRSFQQHISVQNANKHNLQNFSVKIPTQTLVVISGVSGSGKSTLIHEIVRKGVHMHLISRSKKNSIEVDGATLSGLAAFKKLVTIGQNPIGQTIRADVTTYSEINFPLREFFASLPEAVARGLQPVHFSSNHTSGMCRFCQGLGFKSICLKFLPPVRVKCDVCHGYRLNPLSLQVAYKGKNFGQILHMTLQEAVDFLPSIPKICKVLDILISIGLGYLVLGQEISSLSGGEAGRMRLSRELAAHNTGKTLYLFDEPTIGLHSDDIAKLIPIFHTLVDQGNTMILVEHNIDIIQNADYLIDLGPGAGDQGGRLVATGTPEEVAKHSSSYTAKYLARNLAL